MHNGLGYKEDRQRFKILIEAYECSPTREHAPGAAWQIVSRLSQWFDVWVLTEEIQYADEVNDYLKDHPELAEHLHFHFIRRHKTSGFNRKRPPLPIRETLDYARWQKDAYRLGKLLHETVRFDVVHHLRSNTFRRPGHLWKLDVPFVWGPMGGTRLVNPGLLAGLDIVSKAQYLIRNVINAIQFRYDPAVRNAIANSTCIFSQTSADRENLRRVYQCDSILLHEQAACVMNDQVHSCNGDRLNIAWIGRCIAGKAMHLLLEAITCLPQKDRVKLHLVGWGPMFEQWKQKAIDLGIEDCCIWYGWVEPEQANRILSDCDMLAITSIQEGTPATVMNALSRGVPVMTLDHCGMGDVIDDACGFPISVDDPKRIILQMSAAIQSVLDRPELIEMKSVKTLESASLHDWDHTAETIRHAYWNCLGIFHPSQQAKHESADELREVVCS